MIQAESKFTETINNQMPLLIITVLVTVKGNRPACVSTNAESHF